MSFTFGWLVVPDYAARKALWQNSPMNKVITPISYYFLPWIITLIASSSILCLLYSLPI